MFPWTFSERAIVNFLIANENKDYGIAYVYLVYYQSRLISECALYLQSANPLRSSFRSKFLRLPFPLFFSSPLTTRKELLFQESEDGERGCHPTTRTSTHCIWVWGLGFTPKSMILTFIGWKNSPTLSWHILSYYDCTHTATLSTIHIKGEWQNQAHSVGKSLSIKK